VSLPVFGRRRAWPSERVLIRAVARGEQDAVHELFDRFWPQAHHAAWLILRDATAAEDVAQESFVAALAQLDRFDRTRRFGPWLHRIVVNRAIDAARARTARREADVELPALDAVAPDAAAPIDDALLAALGALDVDQRAVIVLRHLLGYTPGEIARLLDVPRGTVNSRLRRGLDALSQDGRL
jgi:RNA polymerase sigma-70 factor (ECF subfamily)